MKAAKFLGVSFTGLLVGLCFSFVFAQEDEVELEKIVVSAYKSEIDPKISPASSDVVSVGEANAAGKFTITDAIKNASSVDYATSGGIGGETGVFIRGSGTEDTQVLLEGIKLYDPMSTKAYFYGFNYMSLDNIKRIEILKGPYSSLYGSGGIGGTISLVTEKGKGKPELSYLQEFGSYDTFREKISSKGSLDKLAYSFSVSELDVNSFYSAKYKDGNHERDPYHNFNSSFRLDYDFTDSLSAIVLTDYTYAKYEYDTSSWTPPYDLIDSDVNWGKFYQGVGGVILKQKLTEYFSHKFTFGYTRTHRIGWEEGYFGGDNWYDGKTQQYKWEGNYALCNWDNLIFGFDYLNESGSGFWTTYTPKHISSTKGYYIQNSFTPVENFFAAASFRVEDDSNFGLHNTYSISGSYLFEKTGTKLKGSYGTGFRAPSLYELYGNYGGNSELNPEESKSYEAGFEQQLPKNFIAGITFFNTDFSNLIEYINLKNINSGEARSYGLENFIQYDFDKNNNIKLAYTYMEAQNQDTKVRLSRRPVNKFNLQAKGVLFNRLEILPEISFIGNRIDGSNKLKAYLLANLAFNYTVNNKLNAFLRFENILNKDYELVYGYQTPKFSWYLGAEYKF